MTLKSILLLMLISVAGENAFSATTSTSEEFGCNLIPYPTTALRLAKGFDYVFSISTPIYIGEGFYESGSALLLAPGAPLEIRWKDPETKYHLASICTRGLLPVWKTKDGVTIGSDLKTVEAINGRAFQLSGLGWDGGGGVLSWQDGSLSHSDQTSCNLWLKFAPSEPIKKLKAFQAVSGDRKMSSSNKAMKELNPKVARMCLMYK